MRNTYPYNIKSVTSANICRKCKYFLEDEWGDNHCLYYAKKSLDVIGGGMISSKIYSCYDTRNDEDKCGNVGKLFEQRRFFIIRICEWINEKIEEMLEEDKEDEKD